MPIGGSANFLLGVNRPILYCLEYPLIRKKEEFSSYGRYIYKIGISKNGITRLNNYLTYFPFSYLLVYVLVFPKESLNMTELKKVERFIFNNLKTSKRARPLETTVRLNTARNKLEEESREFWEVDEDELEMTFKKAREYAKQLFNKSVLLARPTDSYRIVARKIPKDMRLTNEEEKKNRDKIKSVSKRATDVLNKMSESQRDQFLNPEKYFEIDL